MFTVSHLSRVAYRWSASAFALRFSQVSISWYVACVGFRSFAQARRLAVYAAPKLPPGLRRNAHAQAGWPVVGIGSSGGRVCAGRGSPGRGGVLHGPAPGCAGVFIMGYSQRPIVFKIS